MPNPKKVNIVEVSHQQLVIIRIQQNQMTRTVSVIIPAYNGALYIGEAIESVLAQDYDDYEIIVVDDGSRDNTKEVVTRYGGRVNYIYQENQGVAQARNRGLECAKGKYIAFLDQDDFFLPNKLSEQVAILEQDSSIGLVNSGWEIVDRQGTKLAAVEPWYNLPQLDLESFIVWKPVFLGAMLFRRSWLDRCGNFDPTLEQTPDVDLVLRLVSIGCPATWVKKATVAYRQHEKNASKNTSLQAQELDQILARFFHNSLLSPKVKALEAESRYQSLVWSAWRLYDTGNLEEMTNYLAKSLIYSKKYPTETVIHWIESFNQYASEYGDRIDVYRLCSSQEWQALIREYVLSGFTECEGESPRASAEG
ncbi:MAG: glycosyltransferase [Xenococcaceae cyanobacterium MO_234.B1]|nr:glycosyltransferase [Xenococcaceae cyanobacterium MO_234.B1]